MLIPFKQKAVATMSSQDGYQRCYYGRQLEDPSILFFIVGICPIHVRGINCLKLTDWESKESHFKFINDPSYGHFKTGLSSLMEGMHFHHISQPDTNLLARAPVTEVATFHDVEQSMLLNIEKFAAALENGKPKGYHGSVYGKVLERIVRHEDVNKGYIKPGDAIVFLLGWDSKEAHLEFRETELFKKTIWLLREKNGGAEMAHVPFEAIE